MENFKIKSIDKNLNALAILEKNILKIERLRDLIIDSSINLTFREIEKELFNICDNLKKLEIEKID